MELLELIGGEPGKGLLFDVGHRNFNRRHRALAFRSDFDDMATAVGGIAASFRQSFAFKVVQDRYQSARIDGEGINQALLTERPGLVKPAQQHGMPWAEPGGVQRLAESRIHDAPVARQEKPQLLSCCCRRTHQENLITEEIIDDLQSLSLINDLGGTSRAA